MEKWKRVPGYDLEASDLGRIRTMDATRLFMRRGKPCKSVTKGKILAPHVSRNGYLIVSPKFAGKRPKLPVHRLIGFTFVDGYNVGLTINHINGKKHDNRAVNLEWCTLAKNTAHQWESGLVDLRGERHPSHKLNSGQVRIIRKLLKMGASCGELAALSGVSTSLIYLIQKGERWNSLPS